MFNSEWDTHRGVNKIPFSVHTSAAPFASLSPDAQYIHSHQCSACLDLRTEHPHNEGYPFRNTPTKCLSTATNTPGINCGMAQAVTEAEFLFLKKYSRRHIWTNFIIAQRASLYEHIRSHPLFTSPMLDIKAVKCAAMQAIMKAVSIFARGMYLGAILHHRKYM